MKRFFIIGFAISIVAILFLIKTLDFDKLINSFSKVSIIKLLPCIAIYLIIHIVRILRWRILLLPLGKVSINSVLSAFSICLLANNILPGHMGELVRAYILADENKLSKSAVLATVVAERVYDGLTVLFILLILLLVLDLPQAASAGEFALSDQALRRVGPGIFRRIFPGPALCFSKAGPGFESLGLAYEAASREGKGKYGGAVREFPVRP